MKNIYNQSEAERNSIVDIPEGYAKESGDTLMRWLGSFWKEIHSGNGMIKGVQGVRGYVLAQAYLDLLEALRLQDRFNAPVFHRELWYPIVIRRSQADTSQENLIELGKHDMVIGEQPSGSVYGEGTMLRIGTLGNFKDYVTYPVVDGSDIRSMASTIVDNILNPRVVLKAGDGFSFENGSVIFPRSGDPFREDTPFEVYDIPGSDPDHPEMMDRETVLWASNVLIDKNYVADHVSYPIGADAPSLAEAKRIVNAAWDAIACGLTPQSYGTLVAAMLNIPTVQSESEVITDITVTPEARVVTTDKNAYKVSLKAKLRDYVRSGEVLHKGQFLDESVRVYPALTNPDPEHVKKISGLSTPINEDVPSISIPPSLIKADTKYGVYVTWDRTTVRVDSVRPLDSNGNPRLYFDVWGQDSDVSSFWEGVWSSAESSGVNMESIVGPEGSEIVPAEFFLKNLIGANTLIVTVSADQVDDISMMRNPMFFGMLSSVVPSATRLLFVEHRSTPEADMVDVGGAGEAVSVNAGLQTRSVYDGAADDVVVRLVRPAPLKVKSKGAT